MAASVIPISSDSSEESVPIVPADPLVAQEMRAVSVTSPAGVLDLVDYSFSDSDLSEDSLPPAPELPLVSPFLCSDDSEADRSNLGHPHRRDHHLTTHLHHHLSFSLPLLLPYPVRINQKSQESSQKRASTDTRIRRVQKEAKESKPKPEKSSLSQNQPRKVKSFPFRVRFCRFGFVFRPFLSYPFLHNTISKTSIYLASSKKPRESEASASKQHPTLSSTGWQITDTREAGVDSSMHRSDPESEHSEQSSDDISMQDEGNDSDMEDTDNAHIPKVSTTTWFKPIPESERPATPEPEWTIPPNDFPEPEHNWANAYATTYKVPDENKLQRKTYDIGSFIKWFCRRTGKKKLCKADLEGPAFNLVKAFHKNSVFLQYQMDECHKLLTNKVDLSNPEGHQIPQNINEPLPLGGPPGQWFRRKEFYINKHSESSDREAVRSQMRILSVINVKVFEKYGYNYLREIILCRADYQEYKISEKNLKNLHPNDFEDLFLLDIQEKLNHLPKTDKTSLHTTVNMWIRNLVIKNRVGDLQLRIESYQTKINLERPNWDAADYYFKKDYTIVLSTRSSCLTETVMIKDSWPGDWKWSVGDKRRSKDFITALFEGKDYRSKDLSKSRKALLEEE
ncbi:hypothetical protein Tco_0909372 [Tanacetum coccineum]|uniref:Uncharacterized protein n=1 Tax=Tanacetum coccineum TaxID=301880 RepID=A0ABQ5CRI7_9ASTR